MSIEQEIRRREKLWKQIRNEYDDLENLERKRLNQLKIYFGGSGVWVDKKDSTGEISSDRNGVTVGLLHTGRHYADDLSREGIIYHYPKTNRTGHRDQNEIAATKNAKRLDITVFVILPGKKLILDA